MSASRALFTLRQEGSSLYADFSHRSNIAPERAGEIDIAGDVPTEEEMAFVLAAAVKLETRLDRITLEHEQRMATLH